jgi:CubicO group peptidase (beta-lactamase class C family)
MSQSPTVLVSKKGDAMKRLLLTILICGLLLWAAQPGWARKWSDTTGKFSVEAELVEVKADKVVLRKAGGAEITVPLARLSQVDRRYLESLDKRAPSQKEPIADRQINVLLKRVSQQSDVPAIAGAIVTSEGLAAFGVAGVRKRGTKSLAKPNDLWHLGSNTKAMTATLLAQLIERDRLSWDTTIADVFSDSSFKIHPDFRDVTVLHLVSHRSGLPANLNLADYLGVDARRERLRAVRQELAKPPQTEPGSNYEYSNLGYIIAGAVVEKRTGKPWQANMVEHVFRPLEMKSAGFGGTGTPGKVDQPWSHTADGQPEPQNGPMVDNPPVMGPAGRVHCTIQDWSKYVADFLRGMTGKPALLPSATYKKLSTPPFGGQYALGWLVTERDWAGGMVLLHNGSNTWNYATVWIAPQRDFAILVCTNQGGDAARAACDAAVVALIEHHAALIADRTARSKRVADTDYGKKSPFTAVRWQATRPVVQVDDQWFKLVSLNELPAAEIVAFSRQTYGNQWRKRFEEDLVELLSRMGHPPQDTVTLVVQSISSSETQVRAGVPMTEANRQAIKARANDR